MAKKKILTDNGQEILPITHESCVVDNNGVSIGSKIGNINELATDSRTDLVSAINDILEFNNETKEQLKDVLIANGVEISEGESWESIIGKLNEKVSSGGGGLDIISATELPATGKENQICVITDNPVDNFILTSNFDDRFTDNNGISLYLSSSHTQNIPVSTLYEVTNGGLTSKYYFCKACQGENRLSSYYYLNGSWVNLTLAYLYFLENGVLSNTDYFGGIYTGSSIWKVAGGYLTVDGNSNQQYRYLTTKNKIDFSLFNNIQITATITNTNSNTISTSYNKLYIYQGAMGVNTTNTNSLTNSNNAAFLSGSNISQPLSTTSGEVKTVTYNISDWTGEHYLGFYWVGGSYITLKITDIKLY